MLWSSVIRRVSCVPRPKHQAQRGASGKVTMTSNGLRVNTVDQLLLSGSEERACVPGETIVEEFS